MWSNRNSHKLPVKCLLGNQLEKKEVSSKAETSKPTP